MIRDEKNIDKLFHDNLYDYEENVPNYVWNNISDQLDAERRKRFIILFRNIAAIVILLLAFAIGNFLTYNNYEKQLAKYSLENEKLRQIANSANNEKKNDYIYIVDNKLNTDNTNKTLLAENENKNALKQRQFVTEKNNKENNEENSENNAFRNANMFANNKAEGKSKTSINSESSTIDIALTENSTEIQLVVSNETKSVTKSEKEFVVEEAVNNNILASNTIAAKNINSNKNEVQNKKPQTSEKVDALSDNIFNSFVDSMLLEENLLNNLIAETNNKSSKWIIGGEIAPVYNYRHTKTSSEVVSPYNAIEKEIYDKSESPMFSYSGGLNIQFKAGKRLSFQSGVYFSQLGQVTEDIYMFTDDNETPGLFNVSTSAGVVETGNNAIAAGDLRDYTDNSQNLEDKPAISIDLQQNFQYIEIPFMLKYKLIERKLDFSIIGGINTTVLVGNSVYAMYDSKKEKIGETSQLRNLNYNASFGCSLGYDLTKKIALNIEPTIKYFIQPINTRSTVDNHLYYFALYTGICYRF